MKSVWQLVASELRYHRILLVISLTGIGVVFGFMTTDRLAYTLLLGYMVACGALILMLNQVKEKRERQLATLPVQPWAQFLARIITPLAFCAGTVLMVWLLMLLPAYRAVHDILILRMPGAFIIMVFYFVASYSLADVKLEKRSTLTRFVYPTLALVIWFVLYMLFILDWSGEFESLGTGIPLVARFLFESPLGILILTTTICVMLYVNWRLYQRRTVFVS